MSDVVPNESALDWSLHQVTEWLWREHRPQADKQFVHLAERRRAARVKEDVVKFGTLDREAQRTRKASIHTIVLQYEPKLTSTVRPVHSTIQDTPEWKKAGLSDVISDQFPLVLGKAMAEYFLALHGREKPPIQAIFYWDEASQEVRADWIEGNLEGNEHLSAEELERVRQPIPRDVWHWSPKEEEKRRPSLAKRFWTFWIEYEKVYTPEVVTTESLVSYTPVRVPGKGEHPGVATLALANINNGALHLLLDLDRILKKKHQHTEPSFRYAGEGIKALNQEAIETVRQSYACLSTGNWSDKSKKYANGKLNRMIKACGGFDIYVGGTEVTKLLKRMNVVAVQPFVELAKSGKYHELKVLVTDTKGRQGVVRGDGQDMLYPMNVVYLATPCFGYVLKRDVEAGLIGRTIKGYWIGGYWIPGQQDEPHGNPPETRVFEMKDFDAQGDVSRLWVWEIQAKKYPNQPTWRFGGPKSFSIRWLKDDDQAPLDSQIPTASGST